MYTMTVHIFKVTDSVCLLDNEGSFDPMTTDPLGHNVHLDHLLKSVATPEDAITLIEQLIEL